MNGMTHDTKNKITDIRAQLRKIQLDDELLVEEYDHIDTAIAELDRATDLVV